MRGRQRLLFAAAAILSAGRASGHGTWNELAGTYFDELEDTAGLSLIQAVSVDAPTTSVGVAATWTWVQPGPRADTTTDTLFSAPGTATLFVQAVAGAPYGEGVRLFQRFFSAADDMRWSNDCVTGNPVSPNCLVYPVSAAGVEALHGARSNQVLLVNDVVRFNDCQTNITCRGSGDYTIAELVLDQVVNRDLFVSGRAYNATWWIRSPGQSPSPPPGGYNDRLAGFEISYAYLTGGSPRTDYFGGATGGCMNPGLGPWCQDRTRGCPVHVRLADPPETGSSTLYRNDPGAPAQSPYTPFSFGFAAGSLTGAANPWDVGNCAADPFGGMNVALCHDPPEGTWTFAINTAGTSGASNVPGASCGSPLVPCLNSRAAALLYVDGLTITAGQGRYLSPAFDSLSPNTKWTAVSWMADLNPEAGTVRTPLEFDWRVADTTVNFTPSSMVFLAGTVLSDETGILPFAGPPVQGRYFQYQALLTSWDLNAANPPPPSGTTDNCLRFSMAYDGSLTPRVRQFAASYQPDAGQIVSNPVAPARLWRWDRIEYRKDDGAGGRVVCDILDEAGGIVLGDIASGGSLGGIDPGRNPSIRVRFQLLRNGTTADPRVYWFRVGYRPLTSCLALNRNGVRLSAGEEVSVRFCTRTTGTVDVTVHDAAGQLVKRLFHGEIRAGDVCQKNWNGTSDPGGRAPASCNINDTNRQGRPVAPGLYFVTVTTPAGRETARVAVSR